MYLPRSLARKPNFFSCRVPVAQPCLTSDVAEHHAAAVREAGLRGGPFGWESRKDSLSQPGTCTAVRGSAHSVYKGNEGPEREWGNGKYLPPGPALHRANAVPKTSLGRKRPRPWSIADAGGAIMQLQRALCGWTYRVLGKLATGTAGCDAMSAGMSHIELPLHLNILQQTFRHMLG
ncbi:hypothetical protein CSOJ01_02344 [Colletotrichum sojae]|uniref:Uncharacterized protein n=1 Tax=Colletotrichum sojae TaxID=2175907 RepID=A0A8H6JQT4_9PEZI|nr:hypothetical protein CSOJ01_02344 [Colletotrichum sojae]